VLVFIEQVEAFQQFKGRHAVTSCAQAAQMTAESSWLLLML
jgi:hypothetical protein